MSSSSENQNGAASSSSSTPQINGRPELNISNKGLEQNKTRKRILKNTTKQAFPTENGFPAFFHLTAKEKANRNRNFGIARKPAYVGLHPMSTSSSSTTTTSSSMIPTMGYGFSSKIPAIKPGISIKLPSTNELNSENSETSNNSLSPFVVPNAFKPLSKRMVSASLGVGAGIGSYGTFGSSSSSSSNPVLSKKRNGTNNTNKNNYSKRRNLGLNKNKKFKRRGTRKN